MITSVDELTEILDRMLGNDKDFMSTPCSRCRELANSYATGINRTIQAETKFKNTNENSTVQRIAQNRVTIRVRLEAAIARRFILHILKDHND